MRNILIAMLAIASAPFVFLGFSFVFHVLRLLIVPNQVYRFVQDRDQNKIGVLDSAYNFSFDRGLYSHTHKQHHAPDTGISYFVYAWNLPQIDSSWIDAKNLFTGSCMDNPTRLNELDTSFATLQVEDSLFQEFSRLRTEYSLYSMDWRCGKKAEFTIALGSLYYNWNYDSIPKYGSFLMKKSRISEKWTYARRFDWN